MGQHSVKRGEKKREAKIAAKMEAKARRDEEVAAKREAKAKRKALAKTLREANSSKPTPRSKSEPAKDVEEAIEVVVNGAAEEELLPGDQAEGVSVVDLELSVDDDSSPRPDADFESASVLEAESESKLKQRPKRRGETGEAAKPRKSRLVILLIIALLAVACTALLFGLGDQSDDGGSPVPDGNGGRGGASTASGTLSSQMRAAKLAAEEIAFPYGNAVAVAVLPVDGGEGFSINGEEQFVASSMIKLLVLAEYMQAVDDGTIDPEDIYVIKKSDLVDDESMLSDNGVGARVSYGRLARLMIRDSDNVATNVLIEALGLKKINARTKALGLEGTELNRKMLDYGAGENYVTANDCALLLRDIAQGTLADELTCEDAEEFLLEQTDSVGLAEGLPNGVEFGHKTGSMELIRHDGGIVYAAKPYVIVVLTTLDYSFANNVMAKISRAVYDNLG